MKTVSTVFLLFLVFSSQLFSQTFYTEVYPQKKIAIQHEVLNVGKYETLYGNDGILNYQFTKQDGTQVQMLCEEKGANIEVFETAPSPYIHNIYKQFYSNGSLRQMGVFLPGFVRVGKWIEINLKGDITVTDYEQDREKLGYNHVLRYLEEESHYNAKEDNVEYSFSYYPKTKQWSVELSKESRLRQRYTLYVVSGKKIKEVGYISSR